MNHFEVALPDTNRSHVGDVWLLAFYLLLLLLLCSHSLNDVPPEPQRNVSIAAVRGAVRPSSLLFGNVDYIKYYSVFTYLVIR